VGSANFSYSAEERNVELGLRLDDAALAGSVEKQMHDLEANVYEQVHSGR
jgi:phospholipase D/transphosphatidylase